MSVRILRRSRAGALVLSLALGLAACGGSGDADSDAAPSAGPSSGGSTASGEPVVLGQVVDLTGPVPGLFKGAKEAMEAYVAKVNSEGGVNGRPLELRTEDSKIDCNGTRQAYDTLAAEVDALVGSVSALDGCIPEVLQKYPELPAVFQQINPAVAAVGTVFSPTPRPPGLSIGPYKYISDKHPGAVEKLGVLVNTQTSFSSDQLVDGLETLGGKVVFTRQVAIDKQTDYTADVIKMRDAGVEWLTLDGFNIETIARILGAAKQQNWRPAVITSAPAYDGNFFTIADPAAAEGVLLPLTTAMFLGEDREESAGVDEYLTWLEKTHPGAKADLFGANAWASGMLYTQALEAAGPDASGQDVVNALLKVQEFDADGLVASSKPGLKQPPTCWIVAQVKGGKFERVEPDSGFSCEGGQYVRYTY